MGLGAQGCGCGGGDQTAGIFGGNWIWILALIFFCCGGRESLAGIFDNNNFFGEDCTWLWIVLAFWCCCKGNRRPHCC